MSNLIYIITNIINDKVYIGQTTNFSKRSYDHFYHHKKLNNHIYLSMRKYGVENFSITPVCSVLNQDDLNDLEIDIIKEYDSFHNGYNMTEGGSSVMSNREHSKKTKDYMSIIKSGKNNPCWTGYYHTPFGILISPKHIKNYTNLLTYVSVFRWCKNPDKVINIHSTKQSKYLTEDMLGKTFREIGFWFEPK